MNYKRLAVGALLGISVLAVTAAVYVRQNPGHGVMDAETPLSDLLTLGNAIATYRITYGTYPPTLVSLGPPAHGQSASIHAANLIDSAAASGHKMGYDFAYQAIDSHGTGKFDAFTIRADPVGSASPQRPHYFMDDTIVIRSDPRLPATASSPQVQ